MGDNKIDHAGRKHSIYAPSAWSRWSRCPASAQDSAGLPEVDSEASLRGTAMHEEAEKLFQNPEYVIGSESLGYPLTEDDKEFVHKAVNAMRELQDALGVLEPPQVSLEHEITLKSYGFPDVFGTLDMSIYDYDTKTLYIADYKFGNNIVPVEKNGQLRIYALGELVNYPEAETIILAINQPVRSQPLSVEILSFAELDDWAYDELFPAIRNAQHPAPQFIPGSEQCKWCPLSGTCTAQRREVLDAFEDVMPEGRVPPPVADWSDMLAKADLMEGWVAAIRKTAQEKLLRGESIPGYKLVHATTHRRWVDEAAVEKFMAGRGIPKAERTTPPKVLPITKAEKIVLPLIKGNTRLLNKWAQLITKPVGALVMVPDTDPKTAVIVDNPLTDAPNNPLMNPEVEI